MPNMNPHKTPMPSQDPKVRAHNFLEVSQGYTEEMAQEEAARCLNCKHRPCVSGCPVHIQIPDFIQQIVKGDYDAAYDIIADASNLPAVCGRVCPQENQCEKVCVRGIKGDPVGIGRLERFVADRHNNQPRQQVSLPAPNGHKVAVIGSGPSGLTCAGDLAKKGYAVTVFEALHLAGGVLVYGIPEFRLPKDIVQKEVDNNSSPTKRSPNSEDNSNNKENQKVPENKEKVDILLANENLPSNDINDNGNEERLTINVLDILPNSFDFKSLKEFNLLDAENDVEKEEEEKKDFLRKKTKREEKSESEKYEEELFFPFPCIEFNKVKKINNQDSPI